MSEMGLTPSEVELTIPSFVLRDRADEIAYWDEQMKMATQKLGTGEVVVSSHNVNSRGSMFFLFYLKLYFIFHTCTDM
jgi:hypothetical protein